MAKAKRVGVVFIVLGLMLTNCVMARQGELTASGRLTAVPEGLSVQAPTEPGLTHEATTTLTAAVQSPTLNASPTATLVAPTATGTSTAVPTMVQPTATTAPVTISQLVTINETGVEAAQLSAGTREYLLQPDSAWLEWHARFNDGRNALAYVARYPDRSEIWVTPLTPWRPERVFVEALDMELGVQWAVSDRYVVAPQIVLDTTGPLEEQIIIRTYVIDMTTRSLATGHFWPGPCTTLAPSPATGNVALWCTQFRPEEPQQYLILEPYAAPWIAVQPPEIIIDDCLEYAMCSWSTDGQYLAFVDQTAHPDALYYTPIDQYAPVRLADELSNYLSWPSWSPNGQYIAYSGGCKRGLQCLVIMDINRRQVVWRSPDSFGTSDQPYYFYVEAFWSPDSQYMAIPVLNPVGENYLAIVAIASGREVNRISFGQAGFRSSLWLK